MALAVLEGGVRAEEAPSALSTAIASLVAPGWNSDYQYALVDLNGDRTPDAIVLMHNDYFCGSGGCTAFVLKGTGIGFKVVSKIFIAREPFAVLTETKHGWKSLSVYVAGGGAKAGAVVLRFNGSKYPSNPTLQPPASAAALREAKVLNLLSSSASKGDGS
jgi:hypothetical protein